MRVQSETFRETMTMHFTMGTEDGEILKNNFCVRPLFSEPIQILEGCFKETSISTNTLVTEDLKLEVVAWSVCKGLPKINAIAWRKQWLIRCNLRLGKDIQIGTIGDSSLMSKKGSILVTLFDN